MVALYTDIDPYCCEWMEALVDDGQLPEGFVSCGDIREINPDALKAYTHCHFFAGIGGWAHALDLAGWPRDWPVWTGSCPCQPYSVAGKREGDKDARNLWPDFRRLICECRPPIAFGEQVASPDGRAWLDALSADLEGIGYAVGSADICAAGVGAPHIRQRLFWVAITNGLGSEWSKKAESKKRTRTRSGFCDSDAELAGLSQSDLRSAKRNRRGRLMGYGNAIVPQVAAEFIGAVMELLRESGQ